jgi:hypothetical protein
MKTHDLLDPARLGACGSTKSALSRHQVSATQLGTGCTKSVSSRYQVVPSQGPSQGPSRDQVRTLTPGFEAPSFEKLAVATRIGLGQKRLNGGAA